MTNIYEKDTVRIYKLTEFSNWRKDLQEEHPYVEVMPGGDTEKEIRAGQDKSKKQKEEEEDPKLKKIKEGVLLEKNSMDSTITKRAKELQISTTEFDRWSKAAKRHSDKYHQLKKRGDVKRAQSEFKKAVDAGHKARSAKSRASHSDPIGSKEYSSTLHPGRVNSKYQSDLKSEKGRRNIAKRSLPIQT